MSATFGTVASENFFGLPFDNVCRKLLGSAENVSIIPASGIAETLSAVPHIVDSKNHRTAVATFDRRII
jgi:hypothetical protein